MSVAGPEWIKGSVRVEIASRIVGYIFNQPNEFVGSFCLETRTRGLKKADEIIALVKEACATIADQAAKDSGGNDSRGAQAEEIAAAIRGAKL